MKPFIFSADSYVIFMGEDVEQFVESQPFPASLKDANSGRYLACNESVSSLAGLKPDEYTGLTAYDIRDMLAPWDPEIVEHAIRMDSQIVTQKAAGLLYNQIWLTKDKSIFIEEVVKKPIFNKNMQIVAILAYGYDLTPFASPEYLFSLYESYHRPAEAISRFLEHLALAPMFDSLPTREQLMILLKMRQFDKLADLAGALNTSVETIEVHIMHLHGKLKVIGLEELVLLLKFPDETKLDSDQLDGAYAKL